MIHKSYNIIYTVDHINVVNGNQGFIYLYVQNGQYILGQCQTYVYEKKYKNDPQYFINQKLKERYKSTIQYIKKIEKQLQYVKYEYKLINNAIETMEN